jgi:hypothetical protein
MPLLRTDGYIPPCIPTRAAKPPVGPDWVHEIKHDGYRLQVRRDGDVVRLFTRRGIRPQLGRPVASGTGKPDAGTVALAATYRDVVFFRLCLSPVGGTFTPVRFGRVQHTAAHILTSPGFSSGLFH